MTSKAFQLSQSDDAPKVEASVNFTWNGTSVVINSSYNIASVVRSGVGSFTVTMSNALADTNYVVTATIMADASSTNDWVQESVSTARTTTVFHLVTLQNSTTVGDPRGISVVVTE